MLIDNTIFMGFPEPFRRLNDSEVFWGLYYVVHAATADSQLPVSRKNYASDIDLLFRERKTWEKPPSI